MKKIILSIAFIASGLVASAQVGVGTTDPRVSLQVDKSAVPTDADGVLVPRVTVAELNTKAITYGDDQNGALVFVTATAGAANETSNVSATGFHYYDVATDKWKAVGGGATKSARVSAVNGLTNADLNGYVIDNAGRSYDFATLAPQDGDTITIIQIGINQPVIASALIAAGSATNTAAGGQGSGISFVYDAETALWYAFNVA